MALCTVTIDGSSLTLESLLAVTRHGARVALSEEAKRHILASRSVVDNLVAAGRPMYGINTGFGKFSEIAIPEEENDLLQLNLIRADACGVGDMLPTDIVRGMLLLRANSLARGLSGTRLVVVETLLEMLNHNVHPQVPAKGSVGSSGDLCPLAHMILPMIGEGEAEWNGQIFDGKEAMARAGIKTVVLKAKEGLALINGTQCMTSLAVHALIDAQTLTKSADVIAALTAESMRGIIDAYDPRLHECRNHSGQIAVAENLRKLLEGSTYTTHQGELRMQDSYSLRCVPQIHGAIRLALNYVASVVKNELNAVTDNPLVFPETGEVISGGNFHGEPVAIAADALGVAVAELGSISERRIAKLIDPALNEGLPAFLVSRGGINCGFMVPQYAAAALVSENKVLAHPASVDSIPTSAGQEDHVSMGTIAARKAAEIVKNVAAVLGIEWMCAAQAIELQTHKGVMGRGTRKAFERLREDISFMEDDRVFYKDQAKATNLIVTEELYQHVVAVIGELN